MYCWLLLQTHLCCLWLLLCSRNTYKWIHFCPFTLRYWFYSAIKSLIIRVWLNLPKASSITSSLVSESLHHLWSLFCADDRCGAETHQGSHAWSTPRRLNIHLPKPEPNTASHTDRAEESSPESNTGGRSAHEHGTTFSADYNHVWSSYGKIWLYDLVFSRINI